MSVLVAEPEATRSPDQTGTMNLQDGESRLDPFIRNNPFCFFRALRAKEPVFYDEKLDVYLVTRHDDIVAVLRDDASFSLEHGYQDRWANGFVDELSEILRRDGGVFVRDPAIDPPAHTRVRRLIEQAFSAHRVKTLEPRIRQIVIGVIESLIDTGRADARMDIGTPMTARIICDQLGFDYEEVGTERIARWTTAWLAQMGRMQTRDEMLENARDICDLQNYIIRQIRAREAEPMEDMTSDLVHARTVDGDRLLFEEQIQWIRALLIGGNDTTATAIANLLMVLALDPALAERLHASVDDDRAVARFVEEILRLEPPSHGLYRTATREVRIGDKLIPAGAQVCVLFASGNDDDAVFDDPRHFDPTRTNLGRTLTFGAGIHKCVAAPLARLEVKIAAQEIIRRMDDIRLAVSADELRYLPTLGTQTLEAVPISFARRR